MVLMASNRFICGGLNTSGLLSRLNARPDLFNTIDYRRIPKGKQESPHREVMDIHVRYRDLKDIDRKDFHTSPHVPVWYPAAKELPDAALLALQVCGIVNSEMLGSVFILKLPPGGRIYPHVDKSWNSTYFEKFCVGINGGEGKIFRFEDKTSFEAKEGELYQFENNILHSISNYTNEDWIALIVNCRPVARSFCEL